MKKYFWLIFPIAAFVIFWMWSNYKKSSTVSGNNTPLAQQNQILEAPGTLNPILAKVQSGPYPKQIAEGFAGFNKVGPQ